MKRFISLFTLGAILAGNLVLSANAASTYTGVAHSNGFADVVVHRSSLEINYEETANAADATGSSDTLVGGDAADMLYFGSAQKFDGVSIDIGTAGTGGKYIIEYWNGTDWATLVSETTADLKNNSSSGIFGIEWTKPSDWAKRSVSMTYPEDGSMTPKASEEVYFARLRLTKDYSTAVYADQVGLINYNLVFDVKNELGEDVELTDLNVDFSSSTADATVYAAKDLGGNRFGFALYTPSTSNYTYVIGVRGYVEETTVASLSESTTVLSPILEYNQVLRAFDPVDGSAVSIASAVAGTSNTTCKISSKLAYCPVIPDEDNGNATVYANGYAPSTITLSNRTAESDAQAKKDVTMSYAYIATVKDQNGNTVTNADVRMSSDYDITCKNLGSGQYGCIVPITDSGAIRVSGTGITTYTSSFSTVRDANTDSQVTQTFTLGTDCGTSCTDDEIDLDVESMEWEDDGDFVFTVENEGDEDVDEDESVYISVYVDGIREYYESYKNNSTSSFLNGGKSQTLNFGDDFLDDDEDSYKVKVCVDATDTVDEDDESNNCYEKTVTQDEDNNDGVDLEVEDLYMDGDDLKIDITNSGDDDVDDNEIVKIYVYVDGDLEYTINGDEDDSFFGAGDSDTFNAGDDLFEDHGSSYDVKVCVDATNTVDEDSESNNCRTEDEDDLEEDNDTCDFKDVSGWSKPYIENLCENDIVEGYSNNYFKPNNDITRAEFLKIVLLAAGKDPYAITSADDYSDVSSKHWAYDYITYATYKGYVEGYDNGKFYPDSPISRSEAVEILMRVAEVEDYDFDSSDINFDDVSRHDWFAEAVVWADDEGIVEGYSNDTFRPDNDITRAEAAKIVDVAMEEVFN